MKHHLMLYAPSNPDRMNPDYWRKNIDGHSTWVGPLSGAAWRKVYAGKAGKKPAPAFNECVFLKRSVHQDICAAQVYEPCKRCTVPRAYRSVRLGVPSRVKSALIMLLKKKE